ncbi:MAG: glycosyltransferase family 4 protein [Saprospiraceae bacterium]|nr:glycosyltransferase family 4 protein [Saprospiraceae bacterium]
MLRIGYDAKRLFNNFTGLGIYSRTLLGNLANAAPENEYWLYTPKIKQHVETQRFLSGQPFHVQTPGRGNAAWWRSIGIKKDLSRDGIQLFHGLSHEIPLGLPRSGIPSVVTMHDLIFKRYPDQYAYPDRLIYDWKFRYACRHADCIVAISESTKTDIVEFYDIDPKRIEVIYQSCDARFAQPLPPENIDCVVQKYGLPQNYLLYVGSIIERKNLLRIVQALELLPSDLRLPLAVVGKGGAYEKRVRQYIAEKRLEPWVHFIAPVFAELPALYRGASVFLYPSACEGFGIPVIEALNCGVPVITSNVSSLPEAGGPGAWLVDPASTEDIVEGIRVLLTNEEERNARIAKGLNHARRFDSSVVTKEMLGLYAEILSRP